MRPRVILHMVSTIDGKTDPRRLGTWASAEYETTGKELGGDAWVCGRVTMERDFAKYQEESPASAKSDAKAGPREPHVAKKAESYAVAVDTNGKLRWTTSDIDGDHLVCILSEGVPADYLAMLESHEISYVVAGETAVDIKKALEVLGTSFGITTLLLEGGGHVNAAFVDAACLDEVSLLVVPGIDGRAGIATVFDGRGSEAKPMHLELRNVDKRENGVVWLRYDVSK